MTILISGVDCRGNGFVMADSRMGNQATGKLSNVDKLFQVKNGDMAVAFAGRPIFLPGAISPKPLSPSDSFGGGGDDFFTAINSGGSDGADSFFASLASPDGGSSGGESSGTDDSSVLFEGNGDDTVSGNVFADAFATGALPPVGDLTEICVLERLAEQFDREGEVRKMTPEWVAGALNAYCFGRVSSQMKSEVLLGALKARMEEKAYADTRGVKERGDGTFQYNLKRKDGVLKLSYVDSSGEIVRTQENFSDFVGLIGGINSETGSFDMFQASIPTNSHRIALAGKNSQNDGTRIGVHCLNPFPDFNPAEGLLALDFSRASLSEILDKAADTVRNATHYAIECGDDKLYFKGVGGPIKAAIFKSGNSLKWERFDNISTDVI